MRRGDRGGYCRPRPRFRGSLSRIDGGDYLPILSHLCCILKIFRFIKTVGIAISDLRILLDTSDPDKFIVPNGRATTVEVAFKESEKRWQFHDIVFV